MVIIWRYFRLILITAIFVFAAAPIIAQVKSAPVIARVKPTADPIKHKPASAQLKEFLHLAADANVTFIYPSGFREIKAPNDEYFSFDYGLELPGKEFEIWFQLKSEKENWASYINAQNTQSGQLENPDSLYNGLGTAQAIAFTGDKSYFVRTIPTDVLARYNADAGKSYLLTLLDLDRTKHYKYALLITLQKNHTGTIVAVCFTNEKGPEFFKNIDKAARCLKFKS